MAEKEAEKGGNYQPENKYHLSTIC